MTETEQPATNVIEALRRVMRDLPAIGKDGKAAPQQGGYAYRGIEQITGEAQSLCAKHGVIFVPRVISQEIKDVTVNGKPWTDTILGVEYDVFGPGGVNDIITAGPIVAIGRDNSDKGANKAMTQAFKYALLQTFMISDKEDDADAGSPETDAPQSRATTVKPTTTKRAAPVTKQDDDKKFRKLFAINGRDGTKIVPTDPIARHAWATGLLGKSVESFTDLSAEDVALLEKAAKEQAIHAVTEYTDNDPERPF